MPDWQDFDLPHPLNVSVDRMHTGPGYMVSMFHQLHCLVRQQSAKSSLFFTG